MRLPPLTRIRHRGLFAGGLLALALLLLIACTSIHRHAGCYAPAYAPDGRSVYFVERRTLGLVWGLGFEYLSPPAHVYVLSDELSLSRLDLGRRQVVATDPIARTTPLVNRHVRAYRGRLFQHIDARIGFTAGGDVQVVVEMAVTRQPRSDDFWLGRLWNDASGRWVDSGGWQSGPPPFAFEEGAVLAGDRELMVVPGRDVLPAAVVAYDHVTGAVDVLCGAPAGAASWDEEIAPARLRARSRRPGIERAQESAQVRQALVQRFEAEGLREGDALIAADREMRRLGYARARPTLTARLVDGPVPDGAGVPVFEIAGPEMQSGIFSDIEQAIASPGTAVEKSFTRYIVHRDYTNSAALNAFFESGGSRFRIRYGGRSYELVVE